MNQNEGTMEKSRDRTLLSLLGDLKDDCGKLFRQEAELAKLEIKENASKAGKLTGIAVGGAIVALSGFIVFLIGLSSLLSMAFGSPSGGMAAGQLIVGLLATAVGGLTAYLAAKRLPDQSLIPDQTIASLRSDARKVRNNLS